MATKESIQSHGPVNLPWRLDAWSDKQVVVTGYGRGIGHLAASDAAYVTGTEALGDGGMEPG
jgi:hypothetical protein